MPPKNRVTPHRPIREDAKAKEIQDLRSENKQLKKAVTRLRRELDKARTGIDDPLLTQPEEELPEKASESVVRCPDCSSTHVVAFTTPSGKTLALCKTCDKRFSPNAIK